ncbi:DUF3696 domain-containing protein [Dehalococcoidia bacterium]|nr:DUF3696 domain-containing protein [Dehalococcoidia bacterium]
MLKNLSIENFKGIGLEQSIPLAPITLIYGQNSGGKSSIIHSIVAIKQTFDSNAHSLKPTGLIDLGSFPSLSHKHSKKNKVNFQFKTELKRPIRGPFKIPFDYMDYVSLLLSYRSAKDSNGLFNASILDSIEFNWDYLPKPRFKDYSTSSNFPFTSLVGEHLGKTQTIRLLTNRKKTSKYTESENLYLDFNDLSDIECLSVLLATHLFERMYSRRVSRDGDNLRMDVNPENFKNTIEKIKNCLSDSQLSMNTRFEHPFECSPKGYRRGSTEEYTYRRSIERLLDLLFFNYFVFPFHNLRYLGPVRAEPQRILNPYLSTSSSKTNVGTEGELAAEIMSSNNEITGQVNDLFEKFKIPYKYKTNSVTDDVAGNITTVFLEDVNTGIKLASVDVGFGIGQVMPILVQGIISSYARGLNRRESIICVEQPELHLHPKLQGDLAEFFVETTRGGSVQWVVETHSENLLLRLRKMIRTGEINKDLISVIYVDKDMETSDIEAIHLRLDDDGDFLDEWPHGFFEERLSDMFD